jgi:16S rRNA (adenine1518-N6/adenine1519-N6)-dimethyltransferase
VLEIGPGGGVLTRELLRAGASVVGWELDLAWAAELGRRLLPGEALRIVVGDALDLPWQLVPAGTLVAGNLPYAVATPILERFLLDGEALPRAVFLVQDEVASRLTAAPGSRVYGFLTVTTAALATVTVLARLAPGSFRPAPKVHGAFVAVERRPPVVERAQMTAFRGVVGAAFAHRRKTIENSLGAAFGRDSARAALAAATIDRGRRAETLALDDFVRLFGALRVSVEKNL